jgi:hypothetical protein
MGTIFFPSFPKDLQAEFYRRYNEDAVILARIALILGSILWLAFHIWDRVIDIDDSSKTLMIRIAVVVLAILALLLPRENSSVIFSRS